MTKELIPVTKEEVKGLPVSKVVIPITIPLSASAPTSTSIIKL